jgi:hypothetical protein
VLTIDYDVFEEPGDYVLIRFGHLLLVRRYSDRGDDYIDFMPENPVYPSILDDIAADPWGVVSAVQHIDGTAQTFDLSTRRKISAFEMWEELNGAPASPASSTVSSDFETQINVSKR